MIPIECTRFIDRMIAEFTPELMARTRGWGDPDSRPVFVVGLPRSGTTLVEQVLASHARVHGAGEPREVLRTFEALPALVGRPGSDSMDVLKLLSPTLTKAAARPYLERIDTPAPPNAVRIVDKMPDNVRLLGLIALFWPSARVIVCNRDLRDVAVSCWLTGFETNPWTNNWELMARWFADHQRIMEHWRRTRPLKMLEVRYEDLVVDLEANARRMIDFLDLEWDPACLGFPINSACGANGELGSGSPADSFPFGRTLEELHVEPSATAQSIAKTIGRVVAGWVNISNLSSKIVLDGPVGDVFGEVTRLEVRLAIDCGAGPTSWVHQVR